MGTVQVDIDTDDVLDALSDKEIKREYESRKLGDPNAPSPQEVVQRALTAIRLGRVEDGVAMLEREFFPTWKSSSDCMSAYILAMKVGGQQ